KYRVHRGAQTTQALRRTQRHIGIATPLAAAIDADNGEGVGGASTQRQPNPVPGSDTKILSEFDIDDDFLTAQAAIPSGDEILRHRCHIVLERWINADHRHRDRIPSPGGKPLLLDDVAPVSKNLIAGR